jgi:hypothetical protein
MYKAYEIPARGVYHIYKEKMIISELKIFTIGVNTKKSVYYCATFRNEKTCEMYAVYCIYSAKRLYEWLDDETELSTDILK